MIEKFLKKRFDSTRSSWYSRGIKQEPLRKESENSKMRTRSPYLTPSIRSTRSNRSFPVFHLVIFVLVGLGILVGLGFTVATAVSAQSPESITCTVSSKERVTEVRDGDSVTRLLINTEDCGTLEIGSALMSGNWSPNQTYSSIKENETYNFEVYGFNVDVMNSYKQVKSVQQV